MKPRVCHITTVHKRDDGRILKKECASLAKAGYDVTLLVADNKPDETVCGVKIQSIDFFPKNRLDRILNSKKKMLIKAVEIDADIYHFHDPELISLGLKLIKNGKKVIYDSHEDYPDDIRNKEWMPRWVSTIIGKLFEKYEQYATRRFSAIITVSPQIVARFAKYNEKSFLITNYPILGPAEPFDGTIMKEKQICFTGLISPLWLHENVVRAIETLDICYVIAGPNEAQYFAQLMKEPASTKVRYVGTVPQQQAFEIQRKSIVGMALLRHQCHDKPDLGTMGNTKLFEYMQSKLPVICSDSLLWREIIKKWECGICVPPNDVPAITNAIQFCMMYPEKAALMGENGLSAVQKEYNWTTQENLLLAIYTNILTEENDG